MSIIAIVSPAEVTIKTPEDARKMPCPLGRTFSEPRSNCIADECPLWRWRPNLSTDPRFTSAIQRKLAMLKQEKPDVERDLLHQEAVAVVSANPKDFYIPEAPERGFCGLGGRVDGMAK